MSEMIAGFRLSPQQKRLWSLEEGAAAYAARDLVRLAGSLDAERLESALCRVVARHEILRTVFRRRSGIRFPIQVVTDVPAFAWSAEDLSRLDEAARQQRIEELFRTAGGPFDLERGPVLRAWLLRFAAGDHLLLLALPALCADAGTLGNLVRELSVAYQDPDGLAGEAPLQYTQFSEWQHGLLEEEDGQAAAEGWRQLGASWLAEPLPFEKRWTTVDAFRSETVVALLPAARADAIESFTRLRESSTELFLLACWQVLLARLTGRQDLAVGLIAEGRKYAELGEAMGPLSKALPLRSHLGADRRFSEVCAETGAAVEAALETMEYFSWEDGDASSSIPFPAIGFEYDGSPAAWNTGALSWRLERRRVDLDRFKVRLTAFRQESGLRLEISFDGTFLERADVEQLARHLVRLIESALAEPEARIGDLEILTADERRRLLVDLNEHSFVAPAGRCVHALFEKFAAGAADRAAVVFERSTLTYGELEARANRLARWLQKEGVGPDDRVGLCLHRSLDIVVALLGVLKAGGAYVPLDPGLPAERLAFVLRASGCRAVVSHRDLLGHLPAGSAPVLCMDGDPDLLAGESDLPPVCRATPSNLAYVIFTSGSTGQPKGVAVEHRQLFHYIHAVRAALALPDGASYAMVSTFAADLGNTALFPALCFGGCLHVLSEERSTDPYRLEEYLSRHPIDCMKIVPSHLATLERFVPGGRLLPRRVLILGGEASRIDWVEKLLHADPPPACEVFNHYGPTETTVGVLAYRAGGRTLDGRGGAALPLGRPLGENRIYLVDREWQPVPPGIPGELLVGGPGVSRGYLGRPDLTAERFLPDGFGPQPGGRLYRTGDLARHLSSGDVEFLGRVDHQVKVRGFRIELGEIESALRGHPAVREAVVAAQRGDVTTRLVAYLTIGPATKPEVEDLRLFLGGLLPEYMIPAFFVVLDRLPLTTNGKVDRAALPAPEAVRPDLGREYVAPGDPVEETLAGIWAEVLGLERVGVADKFFALGGDSLHSVRMLALAREKGLEFTLQDLFRHQTIAELARWLEGSGSGMAAAPRSEPFGLISAEDRARMPAGIVDAYPLTSLQQAMFFHMQENPDSPAYHNIYSFHLRAAFDSDALREAVQEAVARYGMLRTAFHISGFSQPLQLVHDSALLEMVTGDLRHLAFAEQEEALRDFIAAEKRRPFDFRRPPLWRMGFHRRTDDTFQFTMTECHPISDGWSTNATFAEIFETYAVLLKGGALVPKPPTTVSYRDFVLLEAAALASDETRRYWSAKLADVTVTRLPRRSEKAAEEGVPVIRRLNFPLDPDLYEGLRRFAQIAEVPFKSVALAAHLRVLGLLSGQSDVLTALLVDGRPEEAGGDQLRGLCLNTVPFRLETGGETWLDLARETFLAESELYPHRRYPLSELQRGWGTAPLLETFFAYLHFRTLGSIARSEEVEVLNYGNTTVSETTFTLCTYLWVDPVPSQSALILTRDERVLDEAAIRGIYGYYRRALEAMVADPKAPYRHHSLLSAAEEEQVLKRWNETRTSYPQEVFAALFAAQAARAPERVAARAGGEAMTYGELASQTDRLARSLVDRGAGPETVVALLLERGLPLLASVVATFKAGAAYLPLDPHHPVERLRQALEQSSARIVVTSGELIARAGEAVAALPAGTRPRLVSFDELLAWDGAGGPLPVSVPASLAYVIFTSGSTGVPKGAMLEQRGMVNHLFAKIDTLGLTERDVVAQTASQCFDISVWQLLAALLVGGRVEIFDSELTHDPSRLLAAVDRAGVTVFETVPSMLAAMLAVDAAAPDLRDLRWMVVTGEALPADLCARWLARFAAIPMVNAYGPTECSDDVTQHLISSAPAAWETSVPIGRALPNLRLYVADRGLHPVPEGVAGELCVGGIGVGRGYLGQPAGSAQVFVPDPFSPEAGGRLYRTGDLVRLQPDGTFVFLGRIDHQVKLRGFRIELEEIESVLSQHPAVALAVALVRDDGEEGARLVAYVVASGEALQGADLRAFLRIRLPDYMIPSVFVQLPELPLTPNGKVDRAALPAPDPELAAGSASEGTPLGVTEDLVAGIWARLLNVERVGIRDNFFDLGGHSLLAAQVIFRVREAFDIDLPMAALFTHPELGEFAANLDELRKAGQGLEVPPLLRVPRGAPLPQSLAQQRLWLVDRLNRGNLGYNLRQACRLRGRLDVAALERSFAELIRRHETLRTSFDGMDDLPVQIIHPPCGVGLPVLDLRRLPEAERKNEIRRQATLEAQTQFDLSREPLLRVKLLWLADDEHVLLFTLHHIVGDAWSLHVVVRELAALYGAFSLGEPSPLPELVFQYADYAVWQREWLLGEGNAALFGYWQQRLAGAPPLLNLPTDRPRPKEQTFRGEGYSLFLSRELADSLEAVSMRQDVTLFMALLAAFKIVLRHYTGQDDIVVGADVSGRDRAETEGMIGFFVNEIVLRTDFLGAAAFPELLARVRETCLGAYLHQDFPFVSLVEKLRAERSLAYMPLFQVAFNLEYIPPAVAHGGPLGIEPLDLFDHQWARMDITLNVARTEFGLELWALYDADLFDRQTIARILDVYKALLERVAAQSDSSLAELEVLMAARDRGNRENEERRFAEVGQQKWTRLRRRETRVE